MVLVNYILLPFPGSGNQTASQRVYVYPRQCSWNNERQPTLLILRVPFGHRYYSSSKHFFTRELETVLPTFIL